MPYATNLKSVIVTINGQEHDLTHNETEGGWSATLVAPGKSSFNQEGGYYPISVTAKDNAGNITTIDDQTEYFGELLRLVVKEKVKPTISIVSPASDAYLTSGTPTITAQFRDDDSGVDESTILLILDGETQINSESPGFSLEAVEGGFDLTYVVQDPLPDGTHTISARVSDHDGNIGEEVTNSFVIDTVAPSLDVTEPIDGLITNQTNIRVAGKAGDVTSGLREIKIVVGRRYVSSNSIQIEEDGSFSCNVPLQEGENVIRVAAIDNAGKRTDIQRTVILDTVPPEFHEVNISPNPADAGATYIIKVEVQ